MPLPWSSAQAGFNVARIVDTMRKVAACLQYLHGNGIVHGDVKQRNILLKHDGGCFLW